MLNLVVEKISNFFRNISWFNLWCILIKLWWIWGKNYYKVWYMWFGIRKNGVWNLNVNFYLKLENMVSLKYNSLFLFCK